jgi:small-conductance mechanosensitive channel
MPGDPTKQATTISHEPAQNKPMVTCRNRSEFPVHRLLDRSFQVLVKRDRELSVNHPITILRAISNAGKYFEWISAVILGLYFMNLSRTPLPGYLLILLS